MTWTLANLIFQIVGGILGGHAIAAAVAEHSFGALGHTAAGAIGGCLSGLFLQTLARTVTETGSIVEPTAAEQAFVQALSGAVAGAAATMVAGFLMHIINQRKSGNS